MKHWLAQASSPLEEPLMEVPSSLTDMTYNYGSAITHMVLTFAVVIILLLVSFWFLRRLIQGRLQRAGSEQSIQILEKRMISHKTMLYLLQIDNKKVLISESQLEISKIESFPLLEEEPLQD